MNVTFAFTETVWDQLTAVLEDPREVAGIITARIADGPAGLTVLASVVSWAPADAYLDRQSDGLQLRSDGWVPAVRAVLRDGGTPVFMHTHPRGQAEFSRYDDTVDDLMLDAVRRMGGDGSYGSLVLAGTLREPAVAGRLFLGETVARAEKFRIAGNRLRLLLPRTAATPDSDIFDRQIRVFGEAGQEVLNALNAAVIGAGGTGSATAEQLARLGTGAITIVDDDIVTAATPTRGYGITTADIGRPKAEVLAEHLLKTGLSPSITPVIAPIQEPVARTAIAHADIVFSCVDGHGARLVLNRWAYAHLAPVVDLAVLITANSGDVTGIDARITWLSPGTACLLCRGRLDPTLAYAEMLDPAERKRLAGEGYVPGAGTPQPAVITFTSLVASLGTTEMLHRLFGLADPGPSEILALVRQRELSRNCLSQRAGCFCSDPAFLGRGMQPPYLDLTWPT